MDTMQRIWRTYKDGPLEAAGFADALPSFWRTYWGTFGWGNVPLKIPGTIDGPAIARIDVGLYSPGSMERLPLVAGQKGFGQYSAETQVSSNNA